jgi:pimeloyl-ACP methyl ester carboxylesterase
MKFLFRRADRASAHGARAGAGSRFLLAIVASFAAATLAAASLSPARAQTDFYTIASSELGFYSNGALIRSQPMWGAPDGAAAYRILYRSEGLNGEPIAVSGVVIVPDGSPPPGGRPIVAWAHPTTGVARACAPSLARVLFRSIQGLRGMLAQGYAVAATDYPGLGTPGPHPYLVGVSEGRAVLDSVRAARTMPGVGGGRTFALWGHSQGGQAVLFAGLLAKEYAPELRLVGVAAAAPATELRSLFNLDLGTPGGNNITAMTLWSWSRVYDAPMLRVVTPEAVPAIDELAGMCIERFFDVFRRRGPSRMLARSFLKEKDFANLPPWRALLTENTPAALSPSIPIFLAQGTKDNIVVPSVTRNYLAKLCAVGSPVTMVWLPGVSHLFAARDSADAAIAWIADRFAGTPAPSNCGQN